MTKNRTTRYLFWRRGRLLGITALLLCAGVASTARAERPLVISTLPFDDANAQNAVFMLLSKHLSAKLDRPVRFEAGMDYDEVIKRLSDGKVDVAFIGAGAYVQARRSGEVRAILRTIRHRTATYRGIVVVKRGSDIAQIADLKGKKFAFVHQKSTAGYYYPMRLLRKEGLKPKTDLQTVFAGGHHKVVRMVAKGEVDAGACFEGAQAALVDPESVVAIARTDPIPGDPVVVRPGLGSALVTKLRSSLIELSVVPEAKTFFTFAEIDGFVPAVDSDYDGVAKLIRRMK